MSVIKFDIQKFNGVINFNRWQDLERVEEITTWEREKVSRHEEKTSQELDEKGLTVIQLCLEDEVFDKFSIQKTTFSLRERLQDHYLKKSLANQLILK